MRFGPKITIRTVVLAKSEDQSSGYSSDYYFWLYILISQQSTAARQVTNTSQIKFEKTFKKLSVNQKGLFI